MFVAHYERTMRGANERLGITEVTKIEADRRLARILLEARNRAAQIIADARVQADLMITEAHDAVNRILAPDREDKPPVADLIGFIAAKHGVTISAIKGESRQDVIVAIRHEAMALVYVRRPDLSLPAIARFFGNRDHTTILHAVRKMGVYRGANQCSSKHRGKS